MIELKLLSSQKPDNMKVEDINGLIDDTLELVKNDYDLKKMCDLKHLDILCQYDANLMPVPCIKSENQQKVLNQIKNTAQAMFNPGKRRNHEYQKKHTYH